MNSAFALLLGFLSQQKGFNKYSVEEISSLLDTHLKYLGLSGKRNCATAQFFIAKYYQQGTFVKQDLRKYIDWMIEAASNKNVMAILEMIAVHTHGVKELKITPSEIKATHWTKELQKMGIEFNDKEEGADEEGPAQ